MKTVATFTDPMDAHLLIARLEGCGIPAHIRDENMVAVDWLYSNAIGGVKVDVADEDWPLAIELLSAGPIDD